MADLNIAETHLLRLLIESHKGGANSMEVRGSALDYAHSLREKGLVQWVGAYLGTSQWSVTDAGLKHPLTFKQGRDTIGL